MKYSENVNIRIFQGWIPEYRVALFDGIAERYRGRVEVWASWGEATGDRHSRTLAIAKYDYSHPVHEFGKIYWQSGMSVKGLKKGDVLVVGGSIHYLSTLWTCLMAKLRGVRIVWWSHHMSPTSTELSAKIRFAIMNMIHVDSVLLYTRAGIDWMRARGYKHPRIFATGNTLDTKKIDDAIRRYDNATLLQWRRENGVDSGNLLLFCSVIREKSQLDIAIKALASPELTGLDCRLAVVGDGPAKDHCVELAKELNVSERVLWLGAIRDQDALAPWFLSAKLFVYPGSIGLSILHSLAYGLPVVVNDCASHNGPEYEVLEEGVNGYSFQEGNVESLASVVARALESQEQLKSLGKNGFDTVRRKYSMDAMVSNFCEAIEAAHTWK